MGLKEEIKEKAKEVGFALCGVSNLKIIEQVEFPPGRGLVRPSKIMPEANSSEYICLYYEIMESRAWRLSKWLWEKKSIKALPTQEIHVKPAAMLAGLGFIGHNTQVITPDYGPNVRWVAVLIDTELEFDKPFTRDLCAEQSLCQKKSLCVWACPYRAIITGPSQGVPPGEKVKYDRCIETHTRDEVLDKIWEKFIRRISDQGFMACTRCSLACPYGKPVD